LPDKFSSVHKNIFDQITYFQLLGGNLRAAGFASVRPKSPGKTAFQAFRRDTAAGRPL
jgi:hypothetical protein